MDRKASVYQLDISGHYCYSDLWNRQLLATIFSLSKNDIGVVVSITMGILLLVSMLFSIKILEEVYLPTIEFIVVSIIQLVLSLFVLMNSYKCTKNKMKSI